MKNNKKKIEEANANEEKKGGPKIAKEK